MSESSTTTAGILLLTVVTIAFGGRFLLQVVGGGVPATEFQKAFFRAGHAHAGVLVILGLVGTLLVDATRLTGFWELLARDGVPAAAILMSAGFFLSAIGKGRERPNHLIWLLYAGALCLAAGTLTLGVGLLAA